MTPRRTYVVLVVGLALLAGAVALPQGDGRLQGTWSVIADRAVEEPVARALLASRGLELTFDTGRLRLRSADGLDRSSSYRVTRSGDERILLEIDGQAALVEIHDDGLVLRWRNQVLPLRRK
jgi:hypothetical protein